MVILPTLKLNFNPRSPWGERHTERYNLSRSELISIHAPRGGSDGHRQKDDLQ